MLRVSDMDAFTISDPRIEPVPESGCWLWVGTVSPQGYGQIGVRGRSRAAHRAVYERHRGAIPKGLVIDHICRVRSCVNPDHLRAVTPSVNNTENSTSPAALNRAKKSCPKCGSEYRWRRHKSGGYEFRDCLPCQTANNKASRKKRLAYLLECERFVAAIDSGDVMWVYRLTDTPLTEKVGLRLRDEEWATFAPTALEAFAKAARDTQ